MQQHADRSVAAELHQKKLLALMMAMFFAFGFCTVLVDTLIPKLKAMFSLSYAEVMLTQFCFFGAYFIVSAPAGWLLGRIGYLRGITVGLLVMAAGALGFTPAAAHGTYPGFLAALFILASGVTLVQVAANPLTAMLGHPAHAPSRLTLAQAFNSLATMVGPLFGSALILSHVTSLPDPSGVGEAALAQLRRTEAKVFELPFFGVALLLLALALVCWALRRWAPPPRAHLAGSYSRVLTNRRLVMGAVGLFTYVGGRGFDRQLDRQLSDAGQCPRCRRTHRRRTGQHLLGPRMVGRFCGAAVLRLVPGRVAADGMRAGGRHARRRDGSLPPAFSPPPRCWRSVCSTLSCSPTIFALAIETLGRG
ncbi:MAG: MFS transporter [Rhodospirillales bacterium]